MYDNFPYSNYHDLNTDWIVKKIKDVETSEANAKASEENAKASEEASAQSATASANSATASAQSATASAQSATASANSATQAQQTVADTLTQIGLLQSRVDNIIPSGTQTEGNTELLDIRVAQDSQVYDSAGNAVRGQYTNLKSIIEANMGVYATVSDYQWVTSSSYPTGFRTGYYDNSGTAQSSSNRLRYQYQLTNNFETQYLWVFTCPQNRALRITEFDNNGTFIQNIGTLATYPTVSTGSKTVVVRPVLGYKYAVTVQLDVTGVTNADITTDMIAGIHLYRCSDALYKFTKTCKIKYESGSFAGGDATERLQIYIPAAVGYLRYDMYHFVDTSNNSNCWQLYHIYHVDKNLENQIDLTITGEYECGIRLDGRSDFSGGHTHGDEIMASVVLLLDGKPTTISSLTDLTNFNELRIIETSTLYDPADSTTVIADHGREYIFSKENLTLNQSIKWKIAAALDNCFLAMFLPSKNRIDRASANTDFLTLNLPSTVSDPLTTITKPKADSVTMWDTSGGFSAQVSVPVYPTGLTGGDTMSISDNGGGNYNKVYFKVCDGYNSTINELWKSTTVYDLDYTE